METKKTKSKDVKSTKSKKGKGEKLTREKGEKEPKSNSSDIPNPNPALHTSSLTDATDNASLPAICQIHTSQRLHFYCDTCNTAVCAVCRSTGIHQVVVFFVFFISSPPSS